MMHRRNGAWPLTWIACLSDGSSSWFIGIQGKFRDEGDKGHQALFIVFFRLFVQHLASSFIDNLPCDLWDSDLASYASY